MVVSAPGVLCCCSHHIKKTIPVTLSLSLSITSCCLIYGSLDGEKENNSCQDNYFICFVGVVACRQIVAHDLKTVVAYCICTGCAIFPT